MKKVIAVILLLTAVVAAALVYIFLNKPAPHAADLLPESTLAFVDIPDLSKSRAEFTKTEFYALWHEPEVQAFLAKPLATLREMGPSVGAPKDADTIGGLVFDTMQGEAFLAVTHVTLFPTFDPGVVCGVDVGTKRIEAMAGLYKLEGQLKRSYPRGTYQNKEYLGVKYVLWETDPSYPICHAFFNSLIVFTGGEDAMRDMIARWTGQVPRDFKRLANSDKFKNIQQHASANHEFLAYANVEEVLNLFGPLLAFAPQTAGVSQKLSLIQAAAYSLSSWIAGLRMSGMSLTRVASPTQFNLRNAKRSRSPLPTPSSIPSAPPIWRPPTRKRCRRFHNRAPPTCCSRSHSSKKAFAPTAFAWARMFCKSSARNLP